MDLKEKTMSDEKDEISEDGPEAISDQDLVDVQGGVVKSRSIGSLDAKFTSNDTILTSVSNDTLFAGGTEDIKGFNIGMPPRKR